MENLSLAQVLDELRSLRQEVAQLQPLRTEIEEMRRQIREGNRPPAITATNLPSTSTPVPDVPGPPTAVGSTGPVDRRTALRAGLIAAGAAAAAVAIDAAPAAAANGSPLILGSMAQGSTAATIFAVNSPTATAGLGVWDVSRAALTPGVFPAISGHAKGESFETGVEGVGEGLNTGVRGVSANGFAVLGTSTTDVGVFGVGAVGVWGRTALGTGVVATADNGTALSASTNTGTGLKVVGRHTHISLIPVTGPVRGAPTADLSVHTRGDLVLDGTGVLWFCVTSGTPGTWRRLTGPAAAGALHVLAAPARVYDSRPGSAPTVGPKTPLSGGVSRTIDCKVNSSGVPTDAVAVMCTVLLVNAASGSGNFTLWANGVAKPAANTMVWGGSTGRFSSLAVTKCGGGANVQVNASAKTDIVLDIVGYYR